MIKSTKVKIGKKKYTLKSHSFRAMFLFEDVANKSMIEIKSTQDQFTYIYCLLTTCNKDFEYSLDEFFDILDEDGENIIAEFTKLTIEKK